MADAPAWATELVAAVCLQAGVVEPRLRWRRARRATSSGVTRRAEGTISLVAGNHELDQRLTLLHELAHWLTLPSGRPRRGRRNVHHDGRFYVAAFELYRR
ncbi:MAG TPA: hypothetical protein VK838_01585, partial [Candidatus Limnocylindrales bacterium]|nr:hypothetical protein [Candidatus Limnocylindrales bacterium]